jgi:hypothetical protein
MSSDWVFDPMVADEYTRTHARPSNLPPHWVRCDFVRDGIRCAKGSGHEHGVGKAAEHEEPK